jgi:hypothetical protein
MRKILVALALLCSFTSSIAFSANAANLSEDIKQIRNTQLIRGELETTIEFNARTKGLYEKYANKKYFIEIDVKTTTNSGYKLLTYNPDAEELTVSLPNLEKKLVWVLRGNDKKIGFLNFSFLQTEPISIESDSYVGRNGFGTEVRVERRIVNSVGIAILGSGNKNMMPQQFKINIIREKVRDLLEKGRLVLEVRADLQNLEKEPSLLIVDKEEIEPSMKRPIHAKQTKHMLPVRLISITLLDGNKNIVLKAIGTEQHTVSLEI